MLSYGAYVAIFTGVSRGVSIIYILIFIFLRAVFNIEMKQTNDEQPARYTVNMHGQEIDIKDSRLVRFCLAAHIGTLFSLITMIFFVGCVVSAEYYYSGDSCPNRAKDCFAFSKSITQYSPVDQFVCNPGESIKTPNSTSYRFVACYGYILSEQTTLDIVNQLGICSGILAILCVLFTFLYRISHHLWGMLIIVLLSLGSFVMLILSGVSVIKTDLLRIYLTGAVMMISAPTIALKYYVMNRPI